MEDIIVLTADKNTQQFIEGLFPRMPAIEGTRNFSFDTFVHPQRDSGIIHDAHEFLRAFHNRYRNALVIFDYEGCGVTEIDRIKIEIDLESKLRSSGWGGRASVIVINPELENWLWINQARLAQAIGWEHQMPLYDWMHSKQLKDESEPKPSRPKEAFETLLKECGTPRSSSIYKALSSRAGYRECQDPAFQKLRGKITEWYGTQAS